MTQETIQIQPLTAHQHAAWLPLWRGYQAFYKADIAPEVSAITWERLLDSHEPMGGALAWNGTEAVGMVHHIRHRSCWTIGRKLIEYVYQLAAAQGCSRVHWLTHETNKDAMLLYDRIAERSGFVQYRRSIK
jgi:GNAT superfamily N-acetyltransferase